MSLLITDPDAGVWEIPETDALPKRIPCSFSWPCMPCAGKACAAFACAGSRECMCVERNRYDVISTMPCVPGVSALCLSACERYLYQLSCEADCIHTRSVATGELLFAAPAGVFPRMMAQDQSGLLLTAGGAVGEAYLFRTPELICEQVIPTRHPCFGAAFWKEGLVLVCAAEGEDIQTVVYTLAPHKVRPRHLIALPGQPGALCVCPDGGHALLSTRDGLLKIDLRTGSILWNQLEWPLCMRLCCRGNTALISDTLDGCVCLLDHRRPWERRILFRGSGAQACFL